MKQIRKDYNEIGAQVEIEGNARLHHDITLMLMRILSLH
jgi:hypothetical protein